MAKQTTTDSAAGAGSTELLLLIPLKAGFLPMLRERWTVHAPEGGVKSPDLAALDVSRVRGIITNGSTGAPPELMDRMPALEIIACFGAGYESVDLAYAKRRGIAVSNAPGVNDATVADHTLGLMLALARGYVTLDRSVREGRFSSSRADRPTLTGTRLGMLGLGNIGVKIATRAAAFDMSVAYCTRTPRKDVPWKHYASPVELARNCDWLVVATPGGPATRGLVDAAVLDALGPKGCLVNISRGSVVDEAALIAALRDKRIAGAALDVFMNEPDVSAELRAQENTVFTPHMAGRSPAAQQGQLDALVANLDACFAGKPLPAPVAL